MAWSNYFASSGKGGHSTFPRRTSTWKLSKVLINQEKIEKLIEKVDLVYKKKLVLIDAYFAKLETITMNLDYIKNNLVKIMKVVMYLIYVP